MSDQRIATRHALGSERQRQRHRREEALGNERDGDADREQQSVAGRRADQHRDREEREADCHRDDGDGADDAIDLLREWAAGVGRPGGELGDAGETGVVADVPHDAASRTVGHEAPGIGLVAATDGSGNALSGQRRNVERQAIGLDQIEIGGNTVTGGEDDEVTDDDVDRVDGGRCAVADHDHLDRQEILEAFGGSFRPSLLQEREHAVHEDHDEDRDTELRHPRHQRQSAGDPQHQREEVGELTEELAPGADRWRRREPVRTVSSQPLGRFGGGQPGPP